jgi:hypothetical protein
MKTNVFKRMKQAASALLTALVICSTFSLFVVYYLSLIEQQSVLNTRSQSWNMAMAITEAGIEEGLENLNDNTTSLGTAPWSYLGSSTYYRSNTLPDGSSYTVFITNNASPSVVARAYVQFGSSIGVGQNISSSFFASVGVGPAPTTLSRAVQVNCAKPNLFTVAVAVKNNIDLKGNGVYTDSFDSSNPAKSTNGQYDSTKYSGDMGDIASNGGITDSVSIQNGNIYGHVHTGPNCPVTVGPNGAVGTHAWQAGNSGFEPGYVLQDANFTFPDTTMPNTSSYLTPTGGVVVVSSNTLVSTTTTTYPLAGTYTGSVTTNTTKVKGVTTTTYTYNVPTTLFYTNTYANILWGSAGSTNYYVSSALTGQSIVMGPNVVLAMPNGMTGVENITINPGANILVYSGGTSFSAAGNQIINPNGYAGSFVVFCASSVTSFTLAGNGQFTGVLVAPNADVSLKGGGNNNEDFSGMLMANSLTLNGHFSFHYDEALLGAANKSRWLITSWNEIP